MLVVDVQRSVRELLIDFAARGYKYAIVASSSQVHSGMLFEGVPIVFDPSMPDGEGRIIELDG